MKPTFFRLAIILLMPLLAGLAYCEQRKIETQSTKHTYSLCPKSDDARARSLVLIKDFSHEKSAELVDRGADATRELAVAASRILEDTGGDLVLVSVAKPNEFRVSFTNLGLRDKFVLSVRYWKAWEQDGSVSTLLGDLESYWTFQTLEGKGIEDDPPCL